jgi:hypothetical protein
MIALTTDLQTDIKSEQIEQLQRQKITFEEKWIELNAIIEGLDVKKKCVENLHINNVELLDHLKVDAKNS